MFEKDAEEYAYTKHCKKCISHCEKKCILVEDDCTTFKDGAEFGYNKANEWHDLRKNPDDLPKDCKGKLYLVDIYSDSRLKFEYATYTPTVCFWNSEWKRFEILELTVGSRIVNINDVIAWKEIVLPKENK